MSVSSEPIFKGMLFVPKNAVGAYNLEYGIEDASVGPHARGEHEPLEGLH